MTKNNTNPLSKEISPSELRTKIIDFLNNLGFQINPHLRPKINTKEFWRSIQYRVKINQLRYYRKFLLECLPLVGSYLRDGIEINPSEINLELLKVEPNSELEILYKWWNLIWWSIPYSRAVGRQLRFIIWDKTHNAPFGLIGLQSPLLRLGPRDKFLGISKEEREIIINMSLQANRVGALPPYNELIGGKLVALALTCNEIRDIYSLKYRDSLTLIKKRFIEPKLLFITTTSAYGRSSLYNRLTYRGEKVAISVGFTSGSGTFHLPDDLYSYIIEFLKSQGISVKRGFGSGPSRKLRLITKGLRLLNLDGYELHGLKREIFIFPLVKNLLEVINNKEEPVWIDRPFHDIVTYWLERWAIPRSKRKLDWKKFKGYKFLHRTKMTIENL